MQQLVSGAHPGDSEPALRELDRLVEEVAELTRSPIAPAEFQQRLLERAVHATAAVGGMMWEVRPNNTLHLEHQLLLSSGGALSDAAGVRPHGLLAAAVLQSGQPRRVPPGSRLSDGGAAGNPCEFVLLFCPLGGEGKTVAVLELLLAPAASLAAQEAAPKYVEGTHYVRLAQPVRTADPSRIEVTEVFWYGCGHCYNLEPVISDWEKRLPADVSLVRIPVMWNPRTGVLYRRGAGQARADFAGDVQGHPYRQQADERRAGHPEAV